MQIKSEISFSVNKPQKQLLFGQNPYTIHNSTRSNPISSMHQPLLNDEKLQRLEKIGNYLVLHRYEEAKLIFKENRELLNYSIQVTSPRGFEYNDTAFQILLKNEAYEDAEDLALYLEEDERINQFNKIFPDGEIKGRLNIEEVKKLIENARDAIISDPLINTFYYDTLGKCQSAEEKIKVFDTMSDTTQKTLQALRDLLESQLKEAFKPGLAFDTSIWLIATKIYTDDSLNNRSPDITIFKPKNIMSYLIHVEEFIAGFLGTAYLNLHAQGIAYNRFDKSGLKSGCIVRCHDRGETDLTYFEAFFSGTSYSTPPYQVSVVGGLSERYDGSYNLLQSREYHASPENEYSIEKRRARAMMLGKKQELSEEFDNRSVGFNLS